MPMSSGVLLTWLIASRGGPVWHRKHIRPSVGRPKRSPHRNTLFQQALLTSSNMIHAQVASLAIFFGIAPLAVLALDKPSYGFANDAPATYTCTNNNNEVFNIASELNNWLIPEDLSATGSTPLGCEPPASYGTRASVPALICTPHDMHRVSGYVDDQRQFHGCWNKMVVSHPRLRWSPSSAGLTLSNCTVRGQGRPLAPLRGLVRISRRRPPYASRSTLVSELRLNTLWFSFSIHPTIARSTENAYSMHAHRARGSCYGRGAMGSCYSDFVGVYSKLATIAMANELAIVVSVRGVRMLSTLILQLLNDQQRVHHESWQSMANCNTSRLRRIIDEEETNSNSCS